MLNIINTPERMHFLMGSDWRGHRLKAEFQAWISLTTPSGNDMEWFRVDDVHFKDTAQLRHIWRTVKKWTEHDMPTSSEVIAWSAQWRLEDNAVTCRKCGAQQMEAEEDLPFPHADQCLPVNPEQFPWKELG